MLYASIALFALAAITGLVILVSWLNQKNASRTVVYTHGLLAAVALVLLAVFSFNQPTHYPQYSLLLFGVAALGGFYMFSLDVRGKNSSLAVAGIHALLAVAGFVTLLFFAFS